MTTTKGPMRWAGVFVAISAALHVVAVVVGGFANGVQMLTTAVLYGLFAFGLMNGKRWVGYIAFVVVFMGLSAAIAGIWSTGPIPGWAFSAIAAANLLTVLCLFIALWRPAPQDMPRQA